MARGSDGREARQSKPRGTRGGGGLKKISKARLEKELTHTERELEHLHLDEDPGDVATAKRIAGLNCKIWSIKRRLAAIEEKTLDELDFDRKLREWMTERTRLERHAPQALIDAKELLERRERQRGQLVDLKARVAQL